MSCLERSSEARVLVRTTPFTAAFRVLNLPPVRRVENYPTTSGDVPVDTAAIAACGALDPAELEAELSNSEDPYEDYPEDDDRDVSNSPETAVNIATELKELGNKKFKEGNTEEALAKWESELCICSHRGTVLTRMSAAD
jgi:hypothetical protein